MAKKSNPPAPIPLVRDDSKDLLLVYPGSRVRLNPLYAPQIACFLLALIIPLDRQSRATLRGLKGRDRKAVRAAGKAALKMIDGVQWAISRFTDSVDHRDLWDLMKEWEGCEPEFRHPNGLPLPRPEGDGPTAA